MKENSVESNPVQHSHDFFVISSCSVFGRLQQDVAAGGGHGEPRDIVNFHGLEVDKRQLPGDYEAISEVLAR